MLPGKSIFIISCTYLSLSISPALANSMKTGTTCSAAVIQDQSISWPGFALYLVQTLESVANPVERLFLGQDLLEQFPAQNEIILESMARGIRASKFLDWGQAEDKLGLNLATISIFLQTYEQIFPDRKAALTQSILQRMPKEFGSAPAFTLLDAFAPTFSEQAEVMKLAMENVVAGGPLSLEDIEQVSKHLRKLSYYIESQVQLQQNFTIAKALFDSFRAALITRIQAAPLSSEAAANLISYLSLEAQTDLETDARSELGQRSRKEAELEKETALQLIRRAALKFGKCQDESCAEKVLSALEASKLRLSPAYYLSELANSNTNFSAILLLKAVISAYENSTDLGERLELMQTLTSLTQIYINEPCVSSVDALKFQMSIKPITLSLRVSFLIYQKYNTKPSPD